MENSLLLSNKSAFPLVKHLWCFLKAHLAVFDRTFRGMKSHCMVTFSTSDLTPCGFFFNLGHLNTLIFKHRPNRPKTINELEVAIHQEFSAIKVEMMRQVMQNFTNHLQMSITNKRWRKKKKKIWSIHIQNQFKNFISSTFRLSNII